MEPTPITAPVAATVAHVVVSPGQHVPAGMTLLFLEIMKMEQPVAAPVEGVVGEVLVAVGDTVEVGQRLVTLGPADAAPAAQVVEAADDGPRQDLEEVHRRHAALADEARPDAVAKRHDLGFRTARENVADLVDDGSFTEYGGLAIAAQRARRDVDELIARTPADGLVTGLGTVNADRFGAEATQVAVAAYDYTVLAGTQGHTNHLKKDRLFALAARLGVPVVVYAEGGGGRPGDTDGAGASWLEAEAFRLFAGLSGRVPTIAVVNGRCFAGNAALAGCADVLVATRRANLGMAGPAMIEGGGLGVVAPEDIGPIEVQEANGVVDVVAEDEAEATEVVRDLLGLTQGRTTGWTAPDPQVLRDVVPENRKRPYVMRELLDGLFDVGTVRELRPSYGVGIHTAFARLEGRPVGVLANNPDHLGGAIDAEAADVAARHLQLCDAWGLPVVVLCDTPGFMVGAEAERAGGVRRFSRMFVTGAALRVPLVTVVTRKAYGLGAQAMMGGHLKAPLLTVGWPTAELGPMGLEGAVRLGFRRELEAIDDPDERARREQDLVDMAYAGASGLNVATYGEVDDIIDPADTRARVSAVLAAAPPVTGPARFIDPR